MCGILYALIAAVGLRIDSEPSEVEGQEERDSEANIYKVNKPTKTTTCCTHPIRTLQGYAPVGGKYKRSKTMCIRVFILVMLLLVAAGFVHAHWRTQQRELKVSRISDTAKVRICRMTDVNRFRALLAPLLVPRVVGSEQHRRVSWYLRQTMKNLGFTVEVDSFTEHTPHGEKPFLNIIATYNVNAPKRLVLACHYDSKVFPGAEFIGATDSAVPCAMLLDIATTLAPLLRAHTSKDVTLQLLFLDGEEAFGEWTHSDSLYGARHLAKLWTDKWYSYSEGSSFGINNEIDRIDVFVLLDLLGAPNPRIRNMYGLLANDLFEQLPWIEKDLDRLGCLHRLPQVFIPGISFNAVEDDHVPFLKSGVPVLHLIPTPFPHVWHTLNDTEAALSYPTIDNLISVIRVFTVKYLGLVP